MVKSKAKWQCQVCGETYKTKAHAVACEAVIPTTYPVGCMYASRHFSLEDTHAVATNRIEGHANGGMSWNSRDEDTGKKFVGHEHTFIDGSGRLALGQCDKHVELELPSCQRMIEWLESQGIVPTVWDGEKAISLEEARADPKSRWRYSTGFGTHPRQ